MPRPNDTQPLHSAGIVMSTVVYLAGKSMDFAADLDVRLAEAISEFVHVLWVEPATDGVDAPSNRSRIERITPTLSRLSVSSPACPSRRLSRHLARRRQDVAISEALEELGATSSAVVLADPTGSFPQSIGGHQLYYITDDWVSGAAKYGVKRRAVRAAVERNCRAADTVAAVSHTLALRLHLYSKTIDAVRVVPPGCIVDPTVHVHVHQRDQAAASPIALSGPLDEGLDYDILDAVALTGIHIVATGTKHTTNAATANRVESFLSRPNVHWLDEPSGPATNRHLSAAAVGIAPFVVDAFNRARFPAQPLDYLASGLAVVTTDLPATRWLDSEHVAIAQSPREFAEKVSEHVAAEKNSALSTTRREAASKHSWTVRATTMLRLMALYSDAAARANSETIR
nr:glycosyltransferase [Rhodococcus sp. (in: high G+C Gram-positive bacteria)]